VALGTPFTARVLFGHAAGGPRLRRPLLLALDFTGALEEVLGQLSAQRRDLEDQLGLEAQLLRAVSAGPAPFGEIVAATPLPAVARAHALHLLWRRRLGIDFVQPGTGSSSYSTRCLRGQATDRQARPARPHAPDDERSWQDFLALNTPPRTSR
jgi:hypothetical protein